MPEPSPTIRLHDGPPLIVRRDRRGALTVHTQDGKQLAGVTFVTYATNGQQGGELRLTISGRFVRLEEAASASDDENIRCVQRSFPEP